MAIHRVHRKKHSFSMILNEGGCNPNLSYAARGLLWYLLQKPDNWEIKTEQLVSASSKDGKKRLMNLLAELEEEGYIRRWKTWGKGGKISWHSEIFESSEDAEEWDREVGAKLSPGQIPKRKEPQRNVAVSEASNTPKPYPPEGGDGLGCRGEPPKTSRQIPKRIDGQRNVAVSALSNVPEPSPPLGGYGIGGDGIPFDGIGGHLTNTELINTDPIKTESINSLSLSGSRARENPEPDPEEREGIKISSSPVLGGRDGSYHPEPEECSRTTPVDCIPASPKLGSVAEPTGGGQISSAGGGTQKKMPPWRLSWADGDYEPGFLDYYARIMGEYYQQTKRRSDAIAVIASRETAGETGILHAKWIEYLAEKEGRPVIDITVAAQQDAARLAAIKGNPEAQRAAMVSGPPPTAPVAATKPKSEYEKAIDAAQKGDLSDAIALIHGHTRALRITSTGVITLLQGEGLISDAGTTLDRLSDNGILAVLDYLNDRFKEKFGGA